MSSWSEIERFIRARLKRNGKQLGWQATQWGLRFERLVLAVYTSRAEFHQDAENKRLAEAGLAPRLRLTDRHFDNAHDEFTSNPSLFFDLLKNEDGD